MRDMDAHELVDNGEHLNISVLARVSSVNNKSLPIDVPRYIDSPSKTRASRLEYTRMLSGSLIFPARAVLKGINRGAAPYLLPTIACKQVALDISLRAPLMNALCNGLSVARL